MNAFPHVSLNCSPSLIILRLRLVILWLRQREAKTTSNVEGKSSGADGMAALSARNGDLRKRSNESRLGMAVMQDKNIEASGGEAGRSISKKEVLLNTG